MLPTKDFKKEIGNNDLNKIQELDIKLYADVRCTADRKRKEQEREQNEEKGKQGNQQREEHERDEKGDKDEREQKEEIIERRQKHTSCESFSPSFSVEEDEIEGSQFFYYQ